MAIKINSLQGVSTMSANGTNRYPRVNPRITNRNPLVIIPHFFQGTEAGYFTGQRVPPGAGLIGSFDKFPFASDSSTTDVDSLMTTRRYQGAGHSSDVSGYTSGGFSPFTTPSTTYNIIDKFPFATNANATDVGDLSIARTVAAGQSSNVNGYTSGGYSATPPTPSRFRTTIDKFPFATDGNATNIGALTLARYGSSGQSSDVNGYTSGGYRVPSAPLSPTVNVIDKFPFATDGNATDVGDLSQLFAYSAGQSSTVSGYNSGGKGRAPPGIPAGTYPFVSRNIIEKFPFATNANATDVGDLTASRLAVAGVTSTLSGYTLGGGPDGGQLTKFMDKFPFAADANATDVGDLSRDYTLSTGTQD
jgi:hypothetical protein